MTESARRVRVAEEFRKVLAEEVQRLKDPRVGFVTITGVDVTPDLRRAVVYYTVLGEERDRKATAAGLRSATPRLRSELGRQIRLKFLPELRFEQDDAAAQGDRVEELLRKIHEEEGEA